MRNFARLTCLGLTLALCFASTVAPQAETFRPVVRGKRGAVGAGCAAMLAASVIEFSHFPFGGEVPIIIPGKGSPTVINGQGIAPKLGFADRDTYYGDPDFVNVPAQELLSKDYAALRRKLIDANRVSSKPAQPPGADAMQLPGKLIIRSP